MFKKYTYKICLRNIHINKHIYKEINQLITLSELIIMVI